MQRWLHDCDSQHRGALLWPSVQPASRYFSIFFSIFFFYSKYFRQRLRDSGERPDRDAANSWLWWCFTSQVGNFRETFHQDHSSIKYFPSRAFLYKIFSSLSWSWWQLEWVIINCLKRNVGSGAHYRQIDLSVLPMRWYSDDIFMMLFFSGQVRDHEGEGGCSKCCGGGPGEFWLVDVIVTLTSDWLSASPSSPEERRQGSPAALLLRRPGQGGHQQLWRPGGVSQH